MPDYASNAQGGDDYFADARSSRKPVAPADGKDEDMETAMLPKSILMGKKFEPGDEVVLRIVRMHEDEVEVAYASGEEEKGEEDQAPAEAEPAPAAPPGGAGGDMRSMMA